MMGAPGVDGTRAQSAPALVYKFPGVSCISVNEEAVHGIPGSQEVA
jgi:methionyl aminopeptidase